MHCVRLAFVCLGLAGCFSPQLGEGFACGSDGACPSGYACLVDSCWLEKSDTACEGVAVISGPTSICPDGAPTLSASTGQRYHWSNGETGGSIVASTPGTYRVVVDGCESAPVVVSQPALQLPPNVSVDGSTSFCPGSRDAITLTSDEQPSYRWSNGATTRSITVTEPGSYSVTSEGCFTSAAVEVKAAVEPVISRICEGSYLALEAPAASSYLWSTGAVSRSIAPGAAGMYTVTIDGCLSSPPLEVLAGEVPPVTYEYSGAIATFTVPACVTALTIDAFGAQGGGANTAGTVDAGRGARAKGTVAVTPGETLSVVVGGQGVTGTCWSSNGGGQGGGGGGSFVWRADDPALPLMAAGGGGGSAGSPSPVCANRTGLGGAAATATGQALDGREATADRRGIGGNNGNGGGAGLGLPSNAPGTGGGGWLSAGGGIGTTVDCNAPGCTGGQAGAGGGGNFQGGANGKHGGPGGFGGGGQGVCAGGGGGGFSGGGGGEGSYGSTYGYCGGGGGGSYNPGSNQTNTAGTRTGHGTVIFTW